MPQTTSRRVVICNGTDPHPGKHSGRIRLWAFGYPSLALLLETSEGAVRQLVHDRVLDPADLESVLQYVARRRGWQTRSDQPKPT
jgi:hypothetical protein